MFKKKNKFVQPTDRADLKKEEQQAQEIERLRKRDSELSDALDDLAVIYPHILRDPVDHETFYRMVPDFPGLQKWSGRIFRLGEIKRVADYLRKKDAKIAAEIATERRAAEDESLVREFLGVPVIDGRKKKGKES